MKSRLMRCLVVMLALGGGLSLAACDQAPQQGGGSGQQSGTSP